MKKNKVYEENGRYFLVSSSGDCEIDQETYELYSQCEPVHDRARKNENDRLGHMVKNLFIGLLALSVLVIGCLLLYSAFPERIDPYLSIAKERLSALNTANILDSDPGCPGGRFLKTNELPLTGHNYCITAEVWGNLKPIIDDESRTVFAQSIYDASEDKTLTVEEIIAELQKIPENQGNLYLKKTQGGEK